MTNSRALILEELSQLPAVLLTGLPLPVVLMCRHHGSGARVALQTCEASGSALSPHAAPIQLGKRELECLVLAVLCERFTGADLGVLCQQREQGDSRPLTTERAMTGAVVAVPHDRSSLSVTEVLTALDLELLNVVVDEADQLVANTVPGLPAWELPKAA